MLLAGERKADRSNLHKFSGYLQFHRAARLKFLISIYDAECHLTAICKLFSETPENNSHGGLTREMSGGLLLRIPTVIRMPAILCAVLRIQLIQGNRTAIGLHHSTMITPEVTGFGDAARMRDDRHRVLHVLFVVINALCLICGVKSTL